MKTLSQHFETGIRQGIRRDDVPRFQQRHQRYGQAVLSPIDHQYLLGRCVDAAGRQVPGHTCPFMQTPAMGLITQKGLQISAERQLAQCLSQKVRLAWQ